MPSVPLEQINQHHIIYRHCTMGKEELIYNLICSQLDREICNPYVAFQAVNAFAGRVSPQTSLLLVTNADTTKVIQR